MLGHSMHITFLLTPDKFSAHYLRKQLCRRKPLLGVQVGTWRELLELARTSFQGVATNEDLLLDPEKASSDKSVGNLWYR